MTPLLAPPSEFHAFVTLMSDRLGESRAITIADIGQHLGHRNRRQTEQFLEIWLHQVPFTVVSGASGYYRPATANEINHYTNSLRSRIRCLAIRARTVKRAAAREGWPRAGRLFAEADPQQLLFPTAKNSGGE